MARWRVGHVRRVAAAAAAAVLVVAAAGQAVESGGNASVPECVAVLVDTDPAPAFGLAADYTAGDPRGPLAHNMSGQVLVGFLLLLLVGLPRSARKVAKVAL